MVKLINFFECPHFNRLRYEMNAPLAKNFKSKMQITLLDEETIRKLGIEGIEVLFNEIKPQKDKTLVYKGQRVLVYIRDFNNYNDQNAITLPKFHISYCKTLEKMRNEGRAERYVVANKEDGYFSIRINNGNPEFKQLKVCQTCLDNIRWNNFSLFQMSAQQKQNIVTQFSISEFFKKFPKSLFPVKPAFTFDTAPISEYSENWPKISEEIRRERNFTCDNISCRIQLENDKSSLHVHHVNGLKNDNSKPNLKVLCIRCHAHEPMHEHMKNKNYYEFIERHGLSL